MLWWQSRYDEVIRYGEMGLKVLGDDTECFEAALMNSVIGVSNLNQGNGEKFRKYIYKNIAFIKKLPYSVELRPAYGHIVLAVAGDRDLEAAYDWSKALEMLAGQHHDLRGLASMALQPTIASLAISQMVGRIAKFRAKANQVEWVKDLKTVSVLC
jgi:hypothetical protein